MYLVNFSDSGSFVSHDKTTRRVIVSDSDRDCIRLLEYRLYMGVVGAGTVSFHALHLEPFVKLPAADFTIAVKLS